MRDLEIIAALQAQARTMHQQVKESADVVAALTALVSLIGAIQATAFRLQLAARRSALEQMQSEILGSSQGLRGPNFRRQQPVRGGRP